MNPTLQVDWDLLVRKNRRASIRPDTEVCVGNKVLSLQDGKRYKVVEINLFRYDDPYEIIAERKGKEFFFGEHELRYDTERNPPRRRTSFCEVCDLHFQASFVKNFYSSKKTWLKPYGNASFLRLYSCCRRCEAMSPSNGKVLWMLLKKQIRLRVVAMYWNKLAFQPKYVSTRASEMCAEMGW
tara:strand:+ start:1190 stop:1738 length:549 start_codon:yes stop_codon:yes gene_type:complete